MASDPIADRSLATVCRWRTSGETLDVIEALERIESLLLRLESRLRAVEEATGAESLDVLASAGSRPAEGPGR